MPWLTERQIEILIAVRDAPLAELQKLDRRTLKCLIRRGLVDRVQGMRHFEPSLAGIYYLLGVDDGRAHESIRNVRARRAA
jgi:hypothetical protein